MGRSSLIFAILALILALAQGCSQASVAEPDAGSSNDAGLSRDAGATADAGGGRDAGTQLDTGAPNDAGGVSDAGPICAEEDLSELYTRYVEPFVSGALPQSCSQCHMTGVDLSLYVQDTPCQTMACMISGGLVDLDDPASSQLLEQINLGDPNSSVFSVAAEHQAMLEWITWSARCHDGICGDIEAPCSTGTGAQSTGQNPIGDCSENDLLLKFWDTVIVDRGRCNSCHSDAGAERGTFGPCTNVANCEGNQLCVDGRCRSPGPLSAPHVFEGGFDTLVYANPEHRQLGLNTMYNVLAFGMINAETPLASPLLTKPLLEGFQPTAIYGPGVEIEEIPAGVGEGIYHGGASKFNFRCTTPPCPESGIIDCRRDRPCESRTECRDGERCLRSLVPGDRPRFCRIAGSLCDHTYFNMVDLALEFARCSNR